MTVPGTSLTNCFTPLTFYDQRSTGVVHEDEVELPDFEDVEVNSLSGEIVANSSDEEVMFEDELVVLSLKE